MKIGGVDLDEDVIVADNDDNTAGGRGGISGVRNSMIIKSGPFFVRIFCFLTQIPFEIFPDCLHPCMANG